MLYTMNVTTKLGVPLVFRDLTEQQTKDLHESWKRCNHEITDEEGTVILTHAVVEEE